MGMIEAERRQHLTLAAFAVLLIVAAGAVVSCAADGMRPLGVVLTAAVAVAGLLTPGRIVGALAGALAASVYAGVGFTGDAWPADSWSTIGVVVSLIVAGAAGSEVAARLASPVPGMASASGDEPLEESAPRAQVMAAAHFRQTLDLEIARARRYEHTMSLLMVGVEDWPTLVAQRGPIAARRRLAEVAEAVRLIVRDVDSVSVYGLGLLAILLPETALAGAAVVAEKVERVAHEQGGLTFRVGAASYPDDALTCDELLREAEAALDLAGLARVNVVDRARLD